MGNDDEFAEMLDLINKYEIHPIIDSVHTLENGVSALDRMKSGVFGKVVLKMN